MKKHRLLSKKILFIGIILSVLAIYAIPSVIANSDNGAPEVTIQGTDITPTELRMSVNCTWNPWPGYIYWSDVSTLPLLPDSGWADNIVSIDLHSPQRIELYITDGWQKGDYFEIYKVDGVSPTTAQFIGITPQVPVAGGGVSNPDIAYADPTYSNAKFWIDLEAGTHYFAFREVGHNYGAGAFYVKFCPRPIGGL
jgi:hypothetical protein